jgi:UDP-N-acetylmuramate--alanine ligase
VKRRFQLTGQWNGVSIYDDYAHHPAEIAAVLGAARAGTKGRVFAVVEPHRYTRVRDLFADFAACFKDADHVLVSPMYSAGEAPIDGISPDSLADGIRKTGHGSVAVLADAPDAGPVIMQQATAGDVVIYLGAGNSTEWAYALPEWLAASEPKRAGAAR